MSESKPHINRLSDEMFYALVNGATSRLRAIQDRREFVDPEGLRKEYEHILSPLFTQLEALVLLVRLGFLVTINGEKGRIDMVNDPNLRKLLFVILKAPNTAASIKAVIESYDE